MCLRMEGDAPGATSLCTSSLSVLLELHVSLRIRPRMQRNYFLWMGRVSHESPYPHMRTCLTNTRVTGFVTERYRCRAIQLQGSERERVATNEKQTDTAHKNPGARGSAVQKSRRVVTLVLPRLGATRDTSHSATHAPPSAAWVLRLRGGVGRPVLLGNAPSPCPPTGGAQTPGSTSP